MTHAAEWTLRLSVTPLSESAALVRIGDGERIDPETVDVVTALTRALDDDLPTGMLEIVPAYTTILLEYDALVTDGVEVEHAVRAAAARMGVIDHAPNRTVIIPTRYGGEFGPDLEEMAEEVGLSVNDVVQLHSGGDYRVACMGFSPGWAYLMGLAPELEVPRLRIPRTRIPTGSVAVGGAQTGVYPLETPGGWRLIGRTPIRLFDPARDDPFTLNPGDAVRFQPIDDAAFERIAAETKDAAHV
jgi:inhibitor of KinA